MPPTTMATALLFRKVARSLIFSVSAVLPKIAPYRLDILRILADRNCFFQYSEFDNARRARIGRRPRRVSTRRWPSPIVKMPSRLSCARR